MTKPIHAIRLAPLALAATLALPTTGAFAQETVTVAPAPVVAPPPAPAAQTPTVVLPTFSQPSTAPNLPASHPEPAAAPQTRAVTPRAVTPRAATAPRIAVPVEAAAPVAAAPITAAPVPVAEPATLPEPAPVASAAPAQAPGGSDNTLALAGLAGILVLGGAGIVWARRRSRGEAIDQPIYEEPVVAAPPPIAQAPAFVETPRIAEPDPIAAPIAEPTATYRPATATGEETAGELAEQPLPHEIDDRAELIERMVEAAPDEANPFRTRKARRRRARLLLQGMAADDRQPGTPGTLPTGYDWSKLQPYAAPKRELVDA